MTTLNPITPPPELVKQWEIDATLNRRAASLWTTAFATQAAQWGADTELEASVSWLIENQNPRWAHALRAARRPKPPSLAEQATAELDDAIMRAVMRGDCITSTGAMPLLRAALKRLAELEALPDD